MYLILFVYLLVFVYLLTEEPMTGEHVHKAVLQNDTSRLEEVLETRSVYSVSVIQSSSVGGGGGVGGQTDRVTKTIQSCHVLIVTHFKVKG